MLFLFVLGLEPATGGGTTFGSTGGRPATGGRPTTGGISSLSVKAQCKAKRIELIEEAKMKLARLRATTTVRPCSTHDSHNCSKPSRHIAAAAVAAAAASFALLVVRVFIIIQLMG